MSRIIPQIINRTSPKNYTINSMIKTPVVATPIVAIAVTAPIAIPREIKTLKSLTDKLEEQIHMDIWNNFHIIKKPSIFLFGRGKLTNCYPCKFDGCYDELQRVITIDKSLTSCPDYCFDFNDPIRRKACLIPIIKETTPVLCLFDWSVFKFVKNIEEFMIDIKQIFPKDCHLIFPYEIYGGGITLQVPSFDRNDFIHHINQISAPFYTSDEVRDYYKSDILLTSQDILLATLVGIFTEVSLYKDQRYPFINISTKQTFFAIRI